MRRHDIGRDLLETGHYDLVHCRALLMHLAEPERALARMAAALRPGGWLLVEEGDMEAFAVADPAHPATAMVDRVHRLTMEALQPGDASTSTSAGAARIFSSASGSPRWAPRGRRGAAGAANWGRDSSR